MIRKSKRPNGLVQLIAGRHHFRAEATEIRRSGTGPAGGRASQVPSLPFLAIHLPRQPAIPDEGRSRRNMGLPADGTRYSSATILVTELCARSTRIRNLDACRRNTMSREPQHACRESTLLPGTDGTAFATGTTFDTADSQKPTA